MTDIESPATTPVKRKPGRPRKIQPLETPVVPDSVTTLSTTADIDAESVAMESGFGMARSVGENANDLVSEQGSVDSEQKNPAVQEPLPENAEQFFEVEEPAQPDEPSVFPSGDIFPSYGDQQSAEIVSDVETPDGLALASGDLEIPLLVRELYVEALRDEAEVQGGSLRAHVQSLLDWWIENEFSAITAGR